MRDSDRQRVDDEFQASSEPSAGQTELSAGGILVAVVLLAADGAAIGWMIA